MIEVLTPQTHPFLDEHRPAGRTVLPLAAALDRLVWRAGLAPPFALRNVQVHRLPLCRGAMHLLAQGLTLHEVRGDRTSPLVSAERGEPSTPPPALAPTAPPATDLERFYREAAFHGPRLQALTQVWPAAHGVIATVRTCPPQDWWPEDPRAAWSLDPMLLDGCMQLGLYLAWSALDRRLLPYRADEVAVARALEASAYTVHLQVTERTGDEVTAAVRIEDPAGPVAWIHGLRGRFANLETPSLRPP